MNNFDHSPLSSYNSLVDANLAGFFANARLRRHLFKAGLITKNGEIVSENMYRLNLSRKEHKKQVKDLLAQTIVHKTLDLERVRQAEIRKTLEQIAKIQLVRKVRDSRARTREEYVLPGLKSASSLRSSRSPRAPQGQHATRGRPVSAPARKGKPTLSTLSSSYDDDDEAVIYLDDEGRPISPSRAEISTGERHTSRESADTRSDPADNRRLKSKSQRDPRNLVTLDTAALRKYVMLMSQMEQGRLGVSPYLIPQIPLPPKSPRGSINPRNIRRYRPIKKDTQLGSLKRPSTALHPEETAKLYRGQQESMCEVSMHYHGSTLSLAREQFDRRQKIVVEQQHCGGNTLTVFKDKLEPNSDFSFLSYRHRGYPFSLTIYIDGTMNCRVSTCCEYRHKQGGRIGGKTGHFSIRNISGTVPCYRCQVEKGTQVRSQAVRPKLKRPPKNLEEVRVQHADKPKTTKSEANQTHKQEQDAKKQILVPVEPDEQNGNEKYEDDFEAASSKSDGSSSSSSSSESDQEECDPRSVISLARKTTAFHQDVAKQNNQTRASDKTCKIRNRYLDEGRSQSSLNTDEVSSENYYCSDSYYCSDTYCSSDSSRYSSDSVNDYSCDYKKLALLKIIEKEAKRKSKITLEITKERNNEVNHLDAFIKESKFSGEGSKGKMMYIRREPERRILSRCTSDRNVCASFSRNSTPSASYGTCTGSLCETTDTENEVSEIVSEIASSKKTVPAQVLSSPSYGYCTPDIGNTLQTGGISHFYLGIGDGESKLSSRCGSYNSYSKSLTAMESPIAAEKNHNSTYRTNLMETKKVEHHGHWQNYSHDDFARRKTILSSNNGRGKQLAPVASAPSQGDWLKTQKNVLIVVDSDPVNQNTSLLHKKVAKVKEGCKRDNKARTLEESSTEEEKEMKHHNDTLKSRPNSWIYAVGSDGAGYCVSRMNTYKLGKLKEEIKEREQQRIIRKLDDMTEKKSEHNHRNEKSSNKSQEKLKYDGNINTIHMVKTGENEHLIKQAEEIAKRRKLEARKKKNLAGFDKTQGSCSRDLSPPERVIGGFAGNSDSSHEDMYLELPLHSKPSSVSDPNSDNRNQRNVTPSVSWMSKHIQHPTVQLDDTLPGDTSSQPGIGINKEEEIAVEVIGANNQDTSEMLEIKMLEEVETDNKLKQSFNSSATAKIFSGGNNKIGTSTGPSASQQLHVIDSALIENKSALKTRTHDHEKSDASSKLNSVNDVKWTMMEVTVPEVNMQAQNLAQTQSHVLGHTLPSFKISPLHRFSVNDKEAVSFMAEQLPKEKVNQNAIDTENEGKFLKQEEIVHLKDVDMFKEKINQSINSTENEKGHYQQKTMMHHQAKTSYTGNINDSPVDTENGDRFFKKEEIIHLREVTGFENKSEEKVKNILVTNSPTAEKFEPQVQIAGTRFVANEADRYVQHYQAFCEAPVLGQQHFLNVGAAVSILRPQTTEEAYPVVEPEIMYLSINQSDNSFQERRNIQELEFESTTRIAVGNVSENIQRRETHVLIATDSNDQCNKASALISDDIHNYERKDSLDVAADGHDYSREASLDVAADSHERDRVASLDFAADGHDYSREASLDVAADGHDYSREASLDVAADGHDYSREASLDVAADSHDYSREASLDVALDSHDYSREASLDVAADGHDYNRETSLDVSVDGHDYSREASVDVAADSHDYSREATDSHHQCNKASALISDDIHNYERKDSLDVAADGHDYSREASLDVAADSHEHDREASLDVAADGHDYSREASLDVAADGHDYSREASLDVAADSHKRDRVASLDVAADGHDYSREASLDVAADSHDYSREASLDVAADGHDYNRETSLDVSVDGHDYSREASVDVAADSHDYSREATDSHHQCNKASALISDDIHNYERKDSLDVAADGHDYSREASLDVAADSHEHDREASLDVAADGHDYSREASLDVAADGHDYSREASLDVAADSHKRDRVASLDVAADGHDYSREASLDVAADSHDYSREASLDVAADGHEHDKEASLDVSADGHDYSREASLDVAADGHERDRVASLDVAADGHEHDKVASLDVPADGHDYSREASLDVAADGHEHDRETSLDVAADGHERDREASLDVGADSHNYNREASLDVAADSHEHERGASLDVASGSHEHERGASLDVASDSHEHDRGASNDKNYQGTKVSFDVAADNHDYGRQVSVVIATDSHDQGSKASLYVANYGKEASTEKNNQDSEGFIVPATNIHDQSSEASKEAFVVMDADIHNQNQEASSVMNADNIDKGFEYSKVISTKMHDQDSEACVVIDANIHDHNQEASSVITADNIDEVIESLAAFPTKRYDQDIKGSTAVDIYDQGSKASMELTTNGQMQDVAASTVIATDDYDHGMETNTAVAAEIPDHGREASLDAATACQWGHSGPNHHHSPGLSEVKNINNETISSSTAVNNNTQIQSNHEGASRLYERDDKNGFVAEGDIGHICSCEDHTCGASNSGECVVCNTEHGMLLKHDDNIQTAAEQKDISASIDKECPENRDVQRVNDLDHECNSSKEHDDSNGDKDSSELKNPCEHKDFGECKDSSEHNDSNGDKDSSEHKNSCEHKDSSECKDSSEDNDSNEHMDANEHKNSSEHTDQHKHHSFIEHKSPMGFDESNELHSREHKGAAEHENSNKYNNFSEHTDFNEHKSSVGQANCIEHTGSCEHCLELKDPNQHKDPNEYFSDHMDPSAHPSAHSGPREHKDCNEHEIFSVHLNSFDNKEPSEHLCPSEHVGPNEHLNSNEYMDSREHMDLKESVASKEPVAYEDSREQEDPNEQMGSREHEDLSEQIESSEYLDSRKREDNEQMGSNQHMGSIKHEDLHEQIESREHEDSRKHEDPNEHMGSSQHIGSREHEDSREYEYPNEHLGSSQHIGSREHEDSREYEYPNEHMGFSQHIGSREHEDPNEHLGSSQHIGLREHGDPSPSEQINSREHEDPNKHLGSSQNIGSREHEDPSEAIGSREQEDSSKQMGSRELEDPNKHIGFRERIGSREHEYPGGQIISREHEDPNDHMASSKHKGSREHIGFMEHEDPSGQISSGEIEDPNEHVGSSEHVNSREHEDSSEKIGSRETEDPNEHVGSSEHMNSRENEDSRVQIGSREHEDFIKYAGFREHEDSSGQIGSRETENPNGHVGSGEHVNSREHEDPSEQIGSRETEDAMKYVVYREHEDPSEQIGCREHEDMVPNECERMDHSDRAGFTECFSFNTHNKPDDSSETSVLESKVVVSSDRQEVLLVTDTGHRDVNDEPMVSSDRQEVLLVTDTGHWDVNDEPMVSSDRQEVLLVTDTGHWDVNDEPMVSNIQENGDRTLADEETVQETDKFNHEDKEMTNGEVDEIMNIECQSTRANNTEYQNADYVGTRTGDIECQNIKTDNKEYEQTGNIEYQNIPTITIGYQNIQTGNTEFHNIQTGNTEYLSIPNNAEYHNIPTDNKEYHTILTAQAEYLSIPTENTKHHIIHADNTEYLSIPTDNTGYHNIPTDKTEYNSIPSITIEYPNTQTGSTEFQTINTEYHNIPSDKTEYHNTPTDNAEYHNTPTDNTEYHNTPTDNTEYHNTPTDNTEYHNTPTGNTEYHNAPTGNTEYHNAPTGNTEYHNAPTGNTDRPNPQTDICETSSVGHPHLRLETTLPVVYITSDESSNVSVQKEVTEKMNHSPSYPLKGKHSDVLTRSFSHICDEIMQFNRKSGRRGRLQKKRMKTFSVDALSVPDIKQTDDDLDQLYELNVQQGSVPEVIVTNVDGDSVGDGQCMGNMNLIKGNEQSYRFNTSPVDATGAANMFVSGPERLLSKGNLSRIEDSKYEAIGLSREAALNILPAVHAAESKVPSHSRKTEAPSQEDVKNTNYGKKKDVHVPNISLSQADHGSVVAGDDKMLLYAPGFSGSKLSTSSLSSTSEHLTQLHHSKRNTQLEQR